ncbi:hypothetical protein [Chishuiella sp.]|uniref:hypothetical protein n=1 Tax=Chishuiella sp. TaxID=1969467 RepID=UPI0028B22C8D|nr:hypothetical protein [Chishuiella sp.]
MYIYTMKHMTQFSGLSSQMIILWNKKFKIFREEKIDRESVFNKFELKKLIFTSFLIESNTKFTVEKLATKTPSELQVLVEFELHNYLKKNKKKYLPVIRLLTCVCFSYDEKSFDTIISICFKIMGIEDCCLEIVFPFIKELSNISKTYSVEDAVISYTRNLLKNNLNYFMVTARQNVNLSDRKWLYFLPKNEDDEIELFFAYLHLKINGEDGILLGEDQPLSSVEQCMQSVKFTHIFTYVEDNYDMNMLAEYLELIKKIAPEATIFVATYSDMRKKITTDAPFINVNDPRLFKKYLDKIKEL